MPLYYGFDYSYLLLVVPAIILTLWAQFNVKSTFAKYSKMQSWRGMTGYDSARRILDANGLSHVRIEKVSGDLTDHFNPRDNTVYLSDTVHSVSSAAAVGVAAHEAGLGSCWIHRAREVFDKPEWQEWLRSIGVSEEVAADDACKIEHHISEESFDAIKKFVDSNK